MRAIEARKEISNRELVDILGFPNPFRQRRKMTIGMRHDDSKLAFFLSKTQLLSLILLCSRVLPDKVIKKDILYL